MKGRKKQYTRQAFNLSAVTLKPKYSGPIKLKPAKVIHLKELLPYVSANKTHYFRDILAQQDAMVTASRQGAGDSSDDDEVDADDNLMEYE